jgi:hypothetical protein
MRFAANIRGLQGHRSSVRRELEMVDRLIASVSQYESNQLDLSPDGRRCLIQALTNLKVLRRSISLRHNFLQEAADEVQLMVGRDREIICEINEILSRLEIYE